jgi:hypothetical protein
MSHAGGQEDRSMTQIAEVAQKMTKASKKFFYDPSTKLDWPEHLDASEWTMSPELVSFYGTTCGTR